MKSIKKKMLNLGLIMLLCNYSLAKVEAKAKDVLLLLLLLSIVAGDDGE
jgi:hypothetical protein